MFIEYLTNFYICSLVNSVGFIVLTICGLIPFNTAELVAGVA
jgi:hypothetical protein